MVPMLRTENLSKYYVNGQNVVAGLSRINLSFYRGEFVAITGESGSGKSTLAHVLGGVLPYEDGELYIAGEPTAHYDGGDWESYRRDRIAFISQNYGILAGTSVYDNVESALRLGGMDRKQAAVRTKSILEEVELWPMRRRRAAQLSSGQKQRLAHAPALAKTCPVLIADEPTGNLDPENSEKVIRLLAQAAKERLVILITHEFSEAEDYVTRHIRLHDGLVVGDEQLRPAQKEEWAPSEQKKPRALGGYTASLQLRSRPMWAAVVLLFFMATAFSVFAFLGTFIVATDDTSTRIYQSDAFLNGSKERLVAVRKDGGVFTEEDMQKVLALKNVVSVEPYGYISDMVYAYQEGVDYQLHYSLKNVGSVLDPVYMSHESVEITTRDQFVTTVPATNEEFLTAGRLPETVHEVVAGEEWLLGMQLTVYIQDTKRWQVSAYVKLDVKVVGTTDLGDGLYFSEELGQALTIEYLTYMNDDAESLVLPWYQDVATPVKYVTYVDAAERALAEVNKRPPIPFKVENEDTAETQYRPLQEREVLVSLRLYSRMLDSFGRTLNYDDVYRYGYSFVSMYHPGVMPLAENITGNFTSSLIPGYGAPEDPDGLGNRTAIVGIHDSTYENVIFVSPEVFRDFVRRNLEGTGDQICVTIEDYSYTQRVIDALEEAGYYALSPYVLGSTTQDETLAAQRMQTLYVCLGALLAVILLQLIVLRAMFGMENESYRILSRIGLTWSGAKRSVWLQVLLFVVMGQAVAFGLIGVGSYLGVERLVSLTKYLDGIYWIVLSLVHILVSVVAAKGILAALKKKIYPLAARKRDLAPRRKEAAK